MVDGDEQVTGLVEQEGFLVPKTLTLDKRDLAEAEPWLHDGSMTLSSLMRQLLREFVIKNSAEIASAKERIS